MRRRELPLAAAGCRLLVESLPGSEPAGVQAPRGWVAPAACALRRHVDLHVQQAGRFDAHACRCGAPDAPTAAMCLRAFPVPRGVPSPPLGGRPAQSCVACVALCYVCAAPCDTPITRLTTPNAGGARRQAHCPHAPGVDYQCRRRRAPRAHARSAGSVKSWRAALASPPGSRLSLVRASFILINV